MNLLISFVEWFLRYYLSPMVANASPVLIAGRHRIDFGRKFIDGEPVFGAGKTWEGFILGIYMGFLASIPVYFYMMDPFIIYSSLFASVSALLGDLAGSFIKRRLGIKRGDPAPVLDQLDFAAASTLYYWFIDPFFRSRFDFIVYSLLLILSLHVLTNNIAYYLGIKDRRW